MIDVNKSHWLHVTCEDFLFCTTGNNSILHCAEISWFFPVSESERIVAVLKYADSAVIRYPEFTVKNVGCVLVVSHMRTVLYHTILIGKDVYTSTSLRVRSWSNASLSRSKDGPWPKINKESISRFGDFNDFIFFRTEVCNIKALWFTSIRVLIVSNSGSPRVRLLVYAPINTGNLRRQHLRLQLDVDFFSSRLHAKVDTLYVNEICLRRFFEFRWEIGDGFWCGCRGKTVRSIRSSVWHGNGYGNTEYCTGVLAWPEITNTNMRATAKDWLAYSLAE